MTAFLHMDAGVLTTFRKPENPKYTKAFVWIHGAGGDVFWPPRFRLFTQSVVPYGLPSIKLAYDSEVQMAETVLDISNIYAKRIAKNCAEKASVYFFAESFGNTYAYRVTPILKEMGIKVECIFRHDYCTQPEGRPYQFVEWFVFAFILYLVPWRGQRMCRDWMRYRLLWSKTTVMRASGAALADAVDASVINNTLNVAWMTATYEYESLEPTGEPNYLIESEDYGFGNLVEINNKQLLRQVVSKGNGIHYHVGASDETTEAFLRFLRQCMYPRPVRSFHAGEFVLRTEVSRPVRLFRKRSTRIHAANFGSGR